MELLMHKLSEFNFGEYDARKEYVKDKSYFEKTFIDNGSIKSKTFDNANLFIIVGQKGVGKTALMYKLLDDKKNDGYIVDLINFYEELTHEDYIDLSRSQSFVDIDFKRISDSYDFREIWKKFIFSKVANLFKSNSIEDSFTKFVLGNGVTSKKLIEGLSKSLKIKVTFPIANILTDLSFDASTFFDSQNEISISGFIPTLVD